jgi:hypothetical protein
MAWKVPLKLVLRLPSRVLILRNCGSSLGCLPPVTTALWWQLAVVTARKQASPSERTWLPGARWCLAQSEIASDAKDRISKTVYFGLQSCFWLIWPSDLGCVSCRTRGYRTRKPRLCLGSLRQRAMYRNGFAGIQPDAAAWFSEMWDTWSVVLGTSQ